MLPARQRMRRGVEFDLAVRCGVRVGRRSLVVHALRQVGDADVRVGFVVSRAVGSAVVRNRVRRRLRALVAERLSGMPAGTLLVVRANPSSSSARYQDLARDLDGSLTRAGLRASTRVAP